MSKMGGSRRAGRVAGTSSTVAAFLAFGLAPLATAPAAGADEADWLVDLIDPLFSAASSGAGADPTALSGAVSWEALFNADVYSPLHTDIENWIHSTLGQQVDTLINTLAGQYLIGDGAAGTAADPDGGNAGLLFGDGHQRRHRR